MTTQFQPPPTWASPVLEISNPATGAKQSTFNPVWLQWFVDLTSLIGNNSASAVTGPASSVGGHLAVFNGATGKIIQDTTNTVTGKVNFPGGIVGVTDGSSATVGNVGEVISNSIDVGSAISLTTTVPVDLTSIILTPGDWDVYLGTQFLTGTATNVVRLRAGISDVSATNQLTPGSFSNQVFSGFVPGIQNMSVVCGPFRVNVTTSTPRYAVVDAFFTLDTMSTWGILYARRQR